MEGLKKADPKYIKLIASYISNRVCHLLLPNLQSMLFFAVDPWHNATYQ